MRKWQGFADNGTCPVDLTCGETSPITKSALSLLGETLEREGGVFPVAPRGALFGIRFCLAGVPLHFTPAYYPPSLRDLGCGTKEPQRGDRILGRRCSMAEPLPMKTTRTNPKNKNAPMLSNLFIFAGRKHIHYVYLQYKFKRCAC